MTSWRRKYRATSDYADGYTDGLDGKPEREDGSVTYVRGWRDGRLDRLTAQRYGMD